MREGNERVVRPRLTDAEFFYRSDLQTQLPARREALAGIVFQEQLGSMMDKADRVARLAGHVAIAIGESPNAVKLARRAGELSKCDLLTGMVGEFPELQGLMGREYATSAGEPPAVAEALGEAYLPRFAGDAIPSTDIGRAVALADKLDTLVGIFGIGQKPTGDKDPFALRRHALGTIRMLVERELPLRLDQLIELAAPVFGDKIEDPADKLQDFFFDRLAASLKDQGYTAQEIDAVVIGRVHPRSVAYRGIWQQPDTFPGSPFRSRVPLAWPDQQSRWRAQLEELVAEYAGGDGRIFVAGLVHAEGFYAPLTRVYEQAARVGRQASGANS